jgi:tetratricopeptide (TPR) repeat protein
MSYINKALQKAREEQKLPYPAYEPIISSPEDNGKKSNKRFAVLILILALGIGGVFALWFEATSPKAPAAPKQPASRPEAAEAEKPQRAEASAADVKAPVVAATQKNDPADIPPKGQKDDAKALYVQALENHRRGNLQKAKELYKKVIKQEPRNIEALNNLGVVYMNLNVHKWAVIRLNDALKIKPDYADALYNLACLYAREHNLGKSVDYLKKAVGYNPNLKKWVKEDKDLQVLADLPEFRKLLENDEKR